MALDWNHDGRQGRLIAKSTDGTHFSGRYGYGRNAANFECELTLYRSAHEDLLYGTWREPDSEHEGTLILRLPESGGCEVTVTENTGPETTVTEAAMSIAAVPGDGPATGGMCRTHAGPLPCRCRLWLRIGGGSCSLGGYCTPDRWCSRRRPAPSGRARAVDHLLSITAEQFSAARS